MARNVIDIKVLPGEPLDGSGKVCIHLFVQDERGPFVEPHVLHGDDSDKNKIVAKATRGRLACDPKRLVAPVTRRGVTSVTMRTDDPRAATCPKCIVSSAYAELMDKIAKLEAAR